SSSTSPALAAASTWRGVGGLQGRRRAATKHKGGRRMTERAHAQAMAHLEIIMELIQRLRAAQDAGDEAAEEAAKAEIEELPLEVLVRSGWRRPGEDMEPEEYQILLTTGGPAVRIVGDLDHYGEPTTAV